MITIFLHFNIVVTSCNNYHACQHTYLACRHIRKKNKFHSRGRGMPPSSSVSLNTYIHEFVIVLTTQALLDIESQSALIFFGCFYACFFFFCLHKI